MLGEHFTLVQSCKKENKKICLRQIFAKRKIIFLREKLFLINVITSRDYHSSHLKLQVGDLLSQLRHALGVLRVSDLGHQQVLPQLPLQLRELPLGFSGIIIKLRIEILFSF